MKRWIGISLGTILGVSHIGMIGMISQQTKFPKLNLPIGEYTSYSVKANKDGYIINYRAHDPKVMVTVKRQDKPAGFLGFGKSKTHIEKQYMAEGALHTQGGNSGSELNAKTIACIKKRGSGEGTGRLVGGGLGTAAVGVTGVASIPVVGWVLAGAMTMMGMEQGAEIGGNMAADLAKECNEVEEDIK
tara:strand:- start:617 stop:1180 length:564 start_codon:yes stop_codon:yes gene_type:complete